MPDDGQLTQIVTIFFNALALGITLYCYWKFPTKRWRFIAFIVWLGISLLASTGLLIAGHVLDYSVPGHFWITKTVDIIGYTAVVATCWSHYRYYKELGYG